MQSIFFNIHSTHINTELRRSTVNLISITFRTHEQILNIGFCQDNIFQNSSIVCEIMTFFSNTHYEKMMNEYQ